MANRRSPRKESKGPDPLLSRLVQAFEWGKGHTHQLLYGIGGVVILIGLVFGWRAWQTRRFQQAEALLYKTTRLLTQAQEAGNTPSDTAIEQLLQLTRTYRATPATAMAHWHLGRLYFDKGDFQAALTAYEQAQRLLPADDKRLLPTLVTLNVAYAQEASDACEKAIRSFETVVQSPLTWLHGEAYLGMGRCYERQGSVENAREIYTRALAAVDLNGLIRQTLEDRLADLHAVGKPAPMTVGPEPPKPAAAAKP